MYRVMEKEDKQNSDGPETQLSLIVAQAQVIR